MHQSDEDSEFKKIVHENTSETVEETEVESSAE